MNETPVSPADYSEETLQVVRTAMALTGDGQGVDLEELTATMMADYAMDHRAAEDAIEYAEYIGALWLGPARGVLLS